MVRFLPFVVVHDVLYFLDVEPSLIPWGQIQKRYEIGGKGDRVWIRLRALTEFSRRRTALHARS
jgi:hypothetical protein